MYYIIRQIRNKDDSAKNLFLTKQTHFGAMDPLFTSRLYLNIGAEKYFRVTKQTQFSVNDG